MKLCTLLSALTLAGAALPAAAQDLVVHPVGSETDLPAHLMKPDGDGPFPAVVIVHDCSGLGPKSSGSPKRWAQQLVPQGYVVLMPDSFTPRGFPDGVCIAGGHGREAVDYPQRAADALGALAALRKLPYVDGARIGIMGGSHGGSTVLMTMSAPVGGFLADAKEKGFAAGLALYPRCDAHYGDWSILRQGGRVGPMSAHFGTYKPLAPLLILSGALDDWTPAEPCRQMAETAKAAGYPIDIVVYPNAHHAFDSSFPVRFVAGRNNPSAPSGKGATTGGNAEAWADAKAQVARFFGERLKRLKKSPSP
jgi:dienelactone hydrolase